MRKSFCDRNDPNPVYACWCWCLSNARTTGKCIGGKSTSALDLNLFLSNKTYACIDPFIHNRKTKSFAHVCKKSWQKWLSNATKLENYKQLYQAKNGSVDVMIMCVITQQKHLAQSGHSKFCVLYILNSLIILTNVPIREQEIKLECMDYFCRKRERGECKGKWYV